LDMGLSEGDAGRPRGERAHATESGDVGAGRDYFFRCELM
jgi:hypothetical protein